MFWVDFVQNTLYMFNNSAIMKTLSLNQAKMDQWFLFIYFTYLFTYLVIYLFSYLFIYFLTYLFTYLFLFIFMGVGRRPEGELVVHLGPAFRIQSPKTGWFFISNFVFPESWSTASCHERFSLLDKICISPAVVLWLSFPSLSCICFYFQSSWCMAHWQRNHACSSNFYS